MTTTSSNEPSTETAARRYPGAVRDTLDPVNDFVAILGILAAYGAALGGVVWLAFRVRRRGIRGVGNSVAGPFEEIWHPAAYRARVEIRVQEERTAPTPSPGDPPGARRTVLDKDQ